MSNSCAFVFSGAFAPGQPLFYVACIALIAVCAALIVYLLLRRPKYVSNSAATLDGLIGKTATVTETVDGDAGTGLVEIDGQGWAARSVYTDEVYEVGSTVTVVAIEGVKVIVKGE
jgi:membrane protein implicated in regulation of membrane protease activity